MQRPPDADTRLGKFKEYLEGADKLIDTIDQVRSIVGKTGIKEHFQEKIKDKLDKYKEKLEKISEIANKPGEYAEKFQEVLDTLKDIDKEYKEIQNIFVQAHKDNQDLPPGYREGLSDLQAVIEVLGKGTSKIVQKLPGFQYIDVNRWFQFTQSFREAAKGLGKAIRVTNTSNIEAARMAQNGDKVPGYTGRSPEEWRKIDRIQSEEAKKREKQPLSEFQKAWRFIKSLST